MSGPHKLFPLGMLCCHCHRWHDLSDAIQHVQLFHPECVGCALETELGRSLLKEAAEAIDIVEENWGTRDELVAG